MTKTLDSYHPDRLHVVMIGIRFAVIYYNDQYFGSVVKLPHTGNYWWAITKNYESYKEGENAPIACAGQTIDEAAQNLIMALICRELYC